MPEMPLSPPVSDRRGAARRLLAPYLADWTMKVIGRAGDGHMRRAQHAAACGGVATSLSLHPMGTDSAFWALDLLPLERSRP